MYVCGQVCIYKVLLDQVLFWVTGRSRLIEVITFSDRQRRNKPIGQQNN